MVYSEDSITKAKSQGLDYPEGSILVLYVPVSSTK